MDTPKKIFLFEDYLHGERCIVWSPDNNGCNDAVEYIRADTIQEQAAEIKRLRGIRSLTMDQVIALTARYEKECERGNMELFAAMETAFGSVGIAIEQQSS